MEEQQPITPLTGPVFDGDGRLTYMGVDGRRYVVDEGAELDEKEAAQVIEVLQQAGVVFEQIEADCRRWLDIVQGSPMNNEEALALLLATLETLLEEKDDDNAEQA